MRGLREFSIFKLMVVGVFLLILVPLMAYVIWHYGEKAFNKLFNLESDETKIARLEHNQKVKDEQLKAIVIQKQLVVEKNLTTTIIKHKYEKIDKELNVTIVKTKKDLDKSLNTLHKEIKEKHTKTRKHKRKQVIKPTEVVVDKEEDIIIDKEEYVKAGFLMFLSINRAYNSVTKLDKEKP